MARWCVLVCICGIALGRGSPPAVLVRFMPGGGASQLIAAEVAGAKREVVVAMFALGREELCEALIAAHARGVAVRVKLDREVAAHPRAAWPRLKAAGVPVLFHTTAGKMHHKYCVIDGRTVLTGSYNWLDSAETKNHENLLVIRDADLARQFLEDWNRVPADDLAPSEPHALEL